MNQSQANLNADALIKLGKAVLKTEADAIHALEPRIDKSFVAACSFILACEGRVVVTGMGKSGHIGNKIAATLASTGTPAFFVHPGEASHGDLGMITESDVVLAISNSGETDELLTIVPLIKRLDIPLICLTGNHASALAKDASVNLDISVEKEACPLGLAPTSSTTVTLALGDALAVALLETRGFTADDFALSHPGGRLGKRLLLRVHDIMHVGDAMPVVNSTASLAQALLEMSSKGLGMTCVTHEDDTLAGVFTDGDLRRLFNDESTAAASISPSTVDIKSIMVSPCSSILATQLAIEAVQIMDAKNINALPVIDQNNKLIGCLNMHTLLHAGVV